MKKQQLLKVLSMLMCLSLLVGFTAACGSDSGNTEDTAAADNETTSAETTAAEEKEPSAYDYLEKVDYDGYKFRIIAPTTHTRFFPSTLVPTEETGEIIYDSAYERNRIVEEFRKHKTLPLIGRTNIRAEVEPVLKLIQELITEGRITHNCILPAPR